LKGPSLAKKNYRFCQELKVLPRRDISFTKREKNSQEEIQML
jgi:hypothetical protein